MFWSPPQPRFSPPTESSPSPRPHSRDDESIEATKAWQGPPSGAAFPGGSSPTGSLQPLPSPTIPPLAGNVSQSDGGSMTGDHTIDGAPRAQVGDQWVSVQATLPPNPDGVRTLGGYEVRGLLGEGGMGKVYLARDPTLDRRVALKTLRPELAAIKSLRERFLEEARSVARLNHQNIIQIYAAGEDGDTPFFAMELIEGKSLREHLTDEGPLPIDRVVGYMIQTVEGLNAALARHLIHRDIKPANLMLTTSGVVKIADFGLAKKLDMDLELTRTGTFVGSPYYMSPEQSEGKALDYRTDIYSLGASMYHLLMGLPPFEGNTPTALMLKHATEQLPEPPELLALKGGSVYDLISRMMAKEPEDRFGSYDELIGALREIGTGEGTVERKRPPSRAKKKAAARTARKPKSGAGAGGSSWMKIAGGMALMVMLGVVAGMIYLQMQETRRLRLATASQNAINRSNSATGNPSSANPSDTYRPTPTPYATPYATPVPTHPPEFNPSTPYQQSSGWQQGGGYQSGGYGNTNLPGPDGGVATNPNYTRAPREDMPDALLRKPDTSPILAWLPPEKVDDPEWRANFMGSFGRYEFPVIANELTNLTFRSPAEKEQFARFMNGLGRGMMESRTPLEQRIAAGGEVTFIVGGQQVRLLAIQDRLFIFQTDGKGGPGQVFQESFHSLSPEFMLAMIREASQPDPTRQDKLLMLIFNRMYMVGLNDRELVATEESSMSTDALAVEYVSSVGSSGPPGGGGPPGFHTGAQGGQQGRPPRPMMNNQRPNGPRQQRP